MRKLKLDLDALLVDRFDTESYRTGVRGTVQGHGTLDWWCDPSVIWDCAPVVSVNYACRGM